jgi:hypothetical protein
VGSQKSGPISGTISEYTDIGTCVSDPISGHVKNRVNVRLVVNSERFMQVLKGVQAGIDVESKFVDQRIVADLAEEVTLCGYRTQHFRVCNETCRLERMISSIWWVRWEGKGRGRQAVLT